MKAGITGHQDLGPPGTVRWLAQTLDTLITQQGVTHGLTCLAKGADQLFARLLQERHVAYTAILPAAGYERTFGTAADIAEFQCLLDAAADQITLPYAKPTEKAYLAAGRLIVQRADFLFAIWDGKPSQGLGGTGDIVRYAQEQHRPRVVLDPNLHTLTRG